MGEFVEDAFLAQQRHGGVLSAIAPAEDAEEGEGQEADRDMGADAAFGPVEDRPDGEGVLEDAEAVLDAPEFGVAGAHLQSGVFKAGPEPVEAVETGVLDDGCVVDGEGALADLDEPPARRGP